MTARKKRTAGKAAKKATPSRKGRATKKAGEATTTSGLPAYAEAQFKATSTSTKRSAGKRSTFSVAALRKKVERLGLDVRTDVAGLAQTLRRIDPRSRVPVETLPPDIKETIKALEKQAHRFHGAKVSLAWFPWPLVTSPCGDRFGYLTPRRVRAATALPFNATTIGLMDQLGALMGDAGRDTLPDAPIPAGFTYVGQFVDHDITLDVSSALDTPTDANTVHNMRSPSLDLDSVYGRGPALDPFLYVFPSSGPATAIKLQLGSNTPSGPGGPTGAVGNPGGMQVQTQFDVPRIHNPFNGSLSTNTAVIGDPRNDENLIVSQFHHAMLRFHNRIVDMLVLAGTTGDIFIEARKIATHHYQWAVLNDFAARVCGVPAITAAKATVNAPPGSPFRMPVEFAVAAYRFGHSMIRNRYFVNFNFPAATLDQVFQFIRNPLIPVLSNWVVDFNALFDTGFGGVPVNHARKIDSVLANGLETLPGFTGMMAVLAQRNLRRGLALGLPSGQGVAKFFGIPRLTTAQLQQGLPANEIAVLQLNNKLLLDKTPLWYYVLREAMVLRGGDMLGPVGARIVAETFVRILKRDATSFLNVSGGFTPVLPSAIPGDFTFADLLNFAGVTQP